MVSEKLYMKEEYKTYQFSFDGCETILNILSLLRPFEIIGDDCVQFIWNNLEVQATIWDILKNWGLCDMIKIHYTILISIFGFQLFIHYLLFMINESKIVYTKHVFIFGSYLGKIKSIIRLYYFSFILG